MSSKLRVAVIGCGIGKSHVAGFASMPDCFDVLVVCDTNETRANDLARSAGIPRVCTDLADVLAMNDIDVVDIVTPPGAHYTQALQVLAANKHCICEKPLVGSLREVDDLIMAEARSGKRMMPIFQYRYGNGLQKLKLLVDSGIAGRAFVSTVEMAWRRRADYYAIPWRGKYESDLGGAVNGLAVHLLDELTYVLGPVKSVFARTKTMVNPIETEDCAVATMDMADGSLATLAVTLGSSVQLSRHRICFSNMVAESNTQAYANSRDPWTFSGDTPELQQQIDAALAGFTPQTEGYAGQFERYYRAMQAGSDLPVTLADSRRAIELVTALYKSAHSGRPVSLPLRKDGWYNGWRAFMTAPS